jgi:hypothetical protein
MVDARSVATIVPHELERVAEEDKEQIGEAGAALNELFEVPWLKVPVLEEDRRTRKVELGRPRTPEPMGLGMTHLHHLTTNNTDAKVETNN